MKNKIIKNILNTIKQQRPWALGFMSILIVIALSGITAAVGSRLQAGAAPIAAWSFNEGSGSVAYDQAGANDGTITGATWKNENECKSGKCLSFDGTDDYVTATDSSSLDISGAITLSAWVYITSSKAYTSIITKGYTYTGGDVGTPYFLGVNSLVPNFCLESTTSINEVCATSSQSLSTNSWIHLAGTWNGTQNTNLTLYINGTVDKTKNYQYTNILTNSENVTFAHPRPPAPDGGIRKYFNGSIDQMAIYNYARSASQIKADYSSLSSSPSSSSTNLGGKTNDQNDGLVGHWKMDESTWTADSADVVDSSGAGNTGTVKGSGTDPVAGKYGKAGSFNGTTDYVQVSNSTSLTFQTSDFTLESWVKTSGSASKYVLYRGNGSWASAYELATDANNFPFFLIGTDTSAGNYNVAAGTTAVSDGQWHHWVGVRKNMIIFFYFDGILQAQTTLTNNHNLNHSVELDIGNEQGTNFFTGSIDDVKIYNRARSSDQIKRDYATGPPPVAHWKMDDNVSGASATIKDTAGSNNGTTYGSNIDCTKSGKYGNGCKLAGSAEYISAADSAPISPIGLISLIGWIRPTSVSSEQTIVGKWDETTGTDDRSYRLWLDSSNKLNMSVTTDGSTVVTHTGSNTTFAANTWYHVAGLVNPTTGKMDLYVNGVLDVAQKTSGVPATIDDNASNLYIGGKENTSGSLDTLFTGTIDDARIYNYARTPAQIQQDMLGREDWSGGGSQVMAAPRADSGTVGWWDFDEGNGSTALDKSSLSNTLTMTAGATGVNTAAVNMWDLSNKKYGKSGIEFDGDDYLTRADDSDFDFTATEDFSITGWFKHNTISAEQHIINKFSSLGYKVYMDSDGDIVFGIDDDATSFPEDSASTTNKNYDDNAWHQFIGVKTGTSRLDLYIDGVLVASDTSISSTGTLANAGALYIGVNSDGTSNDWDDSYLDSIKIYRSALSSSDAKTAYNRNSALNLGYQAGADPSTSLESSLVGNPPVGHWDFNERTSTVVNDKSGNNKTGTFNGTWTGQGKYGPAGIFDGSDDYVSVGNVTSTLKTLEFWIKPSSTTQKLIDLNATATVDVTAGVVAANNFTGATVYVDGIATTTLSDTNWHQITITASTAVNSSSVNFGLIGATYYSGQMDEIKMFDYVRSAAQIAYDYNKGLPVSWWKFNEGSGNTAYDYMKRNNGTLSSGGSGTNATSQDMWDGGASGKYNKSLEFDGTNDYVDKSVSNFQNNDSTGTISVWIKTSSGSEQIIFASGDEATLNTYYLLLEVYLNKLYIQQSNNDAYDQIYGNTTINNGLWHHVVATSNGSAYSLYVDGKLESLTVGGGSNTGDWFSDTSNRDNVCIGSLKTSSTLVPFNGQIDDVRVYNYALSPLQVKKVFNEGASTRFGPSAGLP